MLLAVSLVIDSHGSIIIRTVMSNPGKVYDFGLQRYDFFRTIV
jgi:hypothetical protein